MAKLLTYSQASARYANLATTGISIEDAIQEAVDAIYDMGRYPGTTREVELPDAVFAFDSESNEYTITFDETAYNGVIGFRNRQRGWSIVDQAALYKDGVNSGDMEFVDLGSVEPADVTGSSVTPLPDGEEPVLLRKYRCPLGWSLDGGPYFALVKLEPPVLSADDLIPVESTQALKCAIQAVCYEYVSDEDRATLSWQKFEMFMSKGTRQASGPKRFTLGLDSSLRRRPRQFY